MDPVAGTGAGRERLQPHGSVDDGAGPAARSPASVALGYDGEEPGLDRSPDRVDLSTRVRLDL